MIPENCHFFGDETHGGVFFKSCDFVYAICVHAWNTYLQIMENSEAKSLFLPSKAHQSVFLNIAHGQAVANAKYVDIPKTTCLKNHQFDSLSSKILSKFFNVMCKNFVSEINSIHIHRKKEGRRMIDQTASQQKLKKLQSEK